MTKVVATKIHMKANKSKDNALTSIKSIYLKGDITTPGFYNKEDIYDWLKENPSIEAIVNIFPFPDLVPVKRNGEKYVKSTPDDTGTDNLLNLPRV